MRSPEAETHIFTCNLCEALCGLRVKVEGGRITGITGDPEDVLSKGHLCPKGPALRELYEDPDRLRTPMRRTARGFEPIGWDEAFDEAARAIRGVRERCGKDAVALYVGNPVAHSHRAAFGSQLLSLALSTRNRFDPNSQDSNPRLFACMQLYGDGLAMPVPDLDRTHHLLILGANPAASNGSQMSAGDVRKRLRAIRARGGRIVLVDPRRTETAAWCDEHHFIRPGGDAALCLAMLNVLFAERRVNEAAVGRIASGLGALKAIAARFSPERVAARIGLQPEVIRTLARGLAEAPHAAVYGRIGTCQNEFGPVACWLIEVLNVVTGNFDREGGVMFPAPAADIGRLARLLIGNHYGRWRSRVRGLPELFGALPSAVMAEEMETEGEGRIRALVLFSGNPVLSTPNGERLSRALADLEYMVAVDFYLKESSRHARIVLPPLTVLETGNYDLLMFGLAVRNVAKYSQPVLPRPADGRDDWDIAAELALRIALPALNPIAPALRRLTGGIPERAIDLLLRTGSYGLSLDALRQVPSGIDLGPLAPAREARVRTRDRRVRLVPPVLAADLERLERWIDDAPAGPLVLIGRRHLRSNNSWMHNLRSLAKGADRATLQMHPGDAAALGLTEGRAVTIKSRTGAATARLEITEDLMPGVISIPHGFGHQGAADTLRVAGRLAGPSANALTDELRVEPIAGTSILNGVPVTVEAEIA